MAGCVRYITLEVNCAFARTAIRELTPKNRRNLDRQERSEKFQELFSSFNLPKSYFDNQQKASLFERDSDKILVAWSKKWYPVEKRIEYEENFSIAKWKSLSNDIKGQHSLANCAACYQKAKDFQRSFPQGPYYEPVILSIDEEKLRSLGPREGTKLVLKQMNTTFQGTFSKTFTKSIVQHGKQGVQFTLSATEKKKKKREMYKKCRNAENDALRQNSAVAVLTECESVRGYNRKRKQLYFEENPPAKRKHKSHVPNLNNVTWDKNQVLVDLQNHPPAPPVINWTDFAREHRVTGINIGQTVKHFAIDSGINTTLLDGKPMEMTRDRRRKRKFLGSEISVPSQPTPDALKKEWQKMVERGEISLGRPCAPLRITKFFTKAGQLQKREITIIGRKFPLCDIRRDLLTKHQSYMRLQPDEEIDEMSYDEILNLFSKYNHKPDANANVEELRAIVKQHQRSRSLILWHDHSTILGLGCLLIMVHVAYDPAVFYTQSEYEESHPNDNIQSIVEQPSIYLLAAGSSSVEDQVSILQDRIDCLHDLQVSICSSNGIMISDKFRFFIGDHPAQQFERGTQLGGTYKCGCVVKSTMMGDLAHSLQRPTRSLHELQQIATNGKFGKQSGVYNPFHKLVVAKLREELRAREVSDYGNKAEVQAKLEGILRGVQRVPTLLLFNPQQPLSTLGLETYAVLDCEPLHDLKGHFGHLVKELPYILHGKLREECEEVIRSTTDNTMTGAKYRVCMIHLYLFLAKHPDVSKQVLLLVETAVRMSELLYMHEASRNPRNILRLYNITWYHHELCNTLFTSFHKEMRNTTFFGHYLHALVVHSPLQMEIVSLRSVNTEHQERVFNQARNFASVASNRHPQNVITTTVLRLQAKKAFRDTDDSIKKSNSIVAKAAAEVPEYSGTVIPSNFISLRFRSWQEHLKRISRYLEANRGVWWDETSSGYRFFDGDQDPQTHLEGPDLQHFRSTTLKDVVENANKAWQNILSNKIELPCIEKEGEEHGVCDEEEEEELGGGCDEEEEELGVGFGGSDEEEEEELGGVDEREEEVKEGEEDEHGRTDKGEKEEHREANEDGNEKEEDVDDDDDDEEEEEEEEEDDEEEEDYDDSEDDVIEDDEEEHENEVTISIECGIEALEHHPISSDNDSFKTKHGAEIAKVLGATSDVVKYDYLRHKLKTSSYRPTKSEIMTHDKLLYSLELAIRRCRSTTLEKLGTLEKQYYIMHGKLPDKDCTPEHTELLVRSKQLNKLLRALNIGET